MSMTMDNFWELADETKVSAQYAADDKLKFLKDASAADIRKICVQYRYFVHNYPENLSYLVAKLPYGELKSLLAEILSEELGSGDASKAHIVWYDVFLKSIGVTDDELKSSLYPENAAILHEIKHKCLTDNYHYAIGLVGMGGECLCQIYLTNMHKYLVQNKFIKDNFKKIDFTFWDYHIGEADIAHRMLVRKAINNMVMDAQGVQSLTKGYVWAKNSWDRFWENNYEDTKLMSS